MQLYIVETIRPAVPEPNELLHAVLQHARHVLHNGLSDRFGVVTGPDAYDLWIARWREALDGAACSALKESHRTLAAAVVEAHCAGLRFLRRRQAGAAAAAAAAPGKARAVSSYDLAAMSDACAHIVAALGEFSAATRVEKGRGTAPEWREATKHLIGARDATIRMRDALASLDLGVGS